MSSAIIIPALNPDERLTGLVANLRSLCASRIIVVNDGSQAQYRSLFDRLESEYGCLVLHHFQNKGKGAALKTGIRAALNNCPMLSGVVTADADGQHTPEDIVRLVSALPEHRGSLILGARGFSSGNVPLHNLLGIRITSLVFFFCTQIFSRIPRRGSGQSRRGCLMTAFPYRATATNMR